MWVRWLSRLLAWALVPVRRTLGQESAEEACAPRRDCGDSGNLALEGESDRLACLALRELEDLHPSSSTVSQDALPGLCHARQTRDTSC